VGPVLVVTHDTGDLGICGCVDTVVKVGTHLMSLTGIYCIKSTLLTSSFIRMRHQRVDGQDLGVSDDAGSSRKKFTFLVTSQG
jgi:hypothetical protein